MIGGGTYIWFASTIYPWLLAAPPSLQHLRRAGDTRWGDDHRRSRHCSIQCSCQVYLRDWIEKNLPGEFLWFPTVIVPVYLLGYPAGIWVGSGDDEMDRRVNLFLQRLHCCRFPCGSRLFGTAIHLQVPHMRPPVLLASTCFLVSKVFRRLY